MRLSCEGYESICLDLMDRIVQSDIPEDLKAFKWEVIAKCLVALYTDQTQPTLPLWSEWLD